MAEETRFAAPAVAGPAVAGPAVAKDEAPAVGLAASQPPVVGLTFGLELGGVIAGDFSEVTGLGAQNAVVETKMVDSKGAPYVVKSPGTLTWLDIHLRKGVTANLDLWSWRQLVVTGKMGRARKSGSILVYDRNLAMIARWDFINGWPSRIEAPIPAADSAGNALEEIVLVHEGLTRVAFGG